MKDADRLARRRALFDENTRVWQAAKAGGDRESSSNANANATLDGSLKKNAAMVNRLKAIGDDNHAKLCDELRRLRFEKFLTEMVASVAVDAVAKLKPTQGDIHGLLEV